MLSAASPSLLARARSQALSLGTEQIWVLLALALPFALVACAVPFTTDTWWALKMGQLAVQAVGPVDTVLAHTPTVASHPNGQWLAHALLYLLYAELGIGGVRVATALLILTTFGLVLAAARANGASARITACAVLLGVLMAASNFTVRAQVFSYLLFGLLVWVLHVGQRRPRLLWSLPPIFAVWANLHGAFLFGLVLIGLHLAGELIDTVARRVRTGAWETGPARRLASVLAISAVAACLNPLGARIYSYVFGVAGNASIRGLITEWQPTTIHDPTGLLFFGSLPLLFATLYASRQRIGAAEALVLLGFGLLAVESGRHVVWWALLLPPILARHLAAVRLPGLPGRRDERPAGSPLNLVAAGLIVLLATLSPLWPSEALEPLLGSRASAAYAPSRAADFLSTLPEGSRLFHAQRWSGYLAWRLWPRQQPMLDGRVESHPGTVWVDYLAVEAVRVDWEAILARYEIDYLVLDPAAQRRLAEQAAASGRWTTLYQDAGSMVLGRDQSAPPRAMGARS